MPNYGWGDDPLEMLVGKTMISVENKDNEEILFTADDGSKYALYHSQDCCEMVTVEDIAGDLGDLVGSPILSAELVTSEENPSDSKPETIEYQESFTWSFYNISTNKGSVTIRWYGESNGYYSESVDFKKVA